MNRQTSLFRQGDGIPGHKNWPEADTATDGQSAGAGAQGELEEELMDLDEDERPRDQSLLTNFGLSQDGTSTNVNNQQQGSVLRSPVAASSQSPFSASQHASVATDSPIRECSPTSTVNSNLNTSTDNQARVLASSPSFVHRNNHNTKVISPPDPQYNCTGTGHALDTPSSEADTCTYTQPFGGQSLPVSTSFSPFVSTSASLPRHPIPHSTPNNRPVPLRLASSTSASSSTASSVRSARRLNHSPYTVPQTAKLLSSSASSSSSPSMTPSGLVTVKDEPRTPVPLPSSPLFDIGVKEEPLEDVNTTPKRSFHSPSASRIASSPGSMSMSHRRGPRPDFPPRMIRTPSGNAIPNGPVGSSSDMRGLLTPQHSASSSSRQPPYPSPIPLISAPLSPPPGTGQSFTHPHPHLQQIRYHQSAPAVPLSAALPQPPTPNGNAAGKGKQSAYQVSLDEIPKDFVIKKLIQLASKYWYAPHSADCHITIPPLHQKHSTQPHVPQTANNAGLGLPTQPGDSFFGPSTSASAAASIQAAAQNASAAADGHNSQPDVLTSSVTTMEGMRDGNGARRGSLPGGNQLEQCLVFPLHKDYLTTQSVLFRTLLNSQAAHMANPPPRDEEGRLIFQSPVIRGAKVLPTRSDRPKALYVPLPDPSSFGVILHWLYWHDIDHFNHCLSKGLVTWQGVIRNIEYLSLDNEIKLLAGKWWKRWVRPTEATERRPSSGLGNGTGPKSASRPGSAVPPSLKSSHRSHHGKGKRRAFSTSAAAISAAAKRDKIASMMMNIDHDDDDDDDEGGFGGFGGHNDDDDEEDGGSDSGDEADDEDIIGAKKANVDGFADNVSLQLGALTY
uniref:Uncharacterized protein n=1 Tax=Kwoniella dejecticola CBS 10117 TaxID=1296121 RepID=A0A1A6A1P0_9TREE|nr:uncharacterized protein I303_06247 [Kwoniella dejecticola CBS 10117]OBR83960.1 hypothetical protein I303_06247 [Kwoniella dejecticola CBS 10117]